MDTNAYTEIAVLIFQENFTEALRRLDLLDAQTTNSQERLLITLRKVQILKFMGDFLGLCKFLRELLVSSNKTEDWPLEVQTKLFETLLDSTLAANDNSTFSAVVSFLLASDDEANKDLGRTYNALKPELVSAPQDQEPSQILHDVIIEFKETPTEVELLMKFANPHFSMEGCVCAFESSSNTMFLSRSNGQPILSIPMKEQVANFSWSFDDKAKRLLIKLQKGEPNKIWRGLHPKSGECLPTILTVKNVSDYMQESQSQPKKKEKNWDKIVQEEEVIDLKEKNYDCDPALHFFKQIYENADEDARRAMLKSFSESGGKALSTNWNEVREKDYAKELQDK